jgi:hypothetical protein
MKKPEISLRDFFDQKSLNSEWQKADTSIFQQLLMLQIFTKNPL